MKNSKMIKTISRQLFEEYLLETKKKIKGKVLDIGAKDATYKKKMDYDDYTTLDMVDIEGVDIVADAQHIPLKTESYAWVICANLLEHVEEPKKVVNECRTVLKSSGKLLIWVPYYFRYHPDPKDYYRFTEDGIRYLLDEFSEVEVRKAGGFFAVVLEIFKTEFAKFNSVFELIWKFVRPLDTKLAKSRYYALGWFVIATK
jgi:SAM-dependent methyltransferase